MVSRRSRTNERGRADSSHAANLKTFSKYSHKRILWLQIWKHSQNILAKGFFDDSPVLVRAQCSSICCSSLNIRCQCLSSAPVLSYTANIANTANTLLLIKLLSSRSCTLTYLEFVGSQVLREWKRLWNWAGCSLNVIWRHSWALWRRNLRWT